MTTISDERLDIEEIVERAAWKLCALENEVWDETDDSFKARYRREAAQLLAPSRVGQTIGLALSSLEAAPAPVSEEPTLGWGDLLSGYQRICAEHGIEPTSTDVLAALKRHDAGEPVEAPKPFCYTASLNLGPHPTIASYAQGEIYTVPLYLTAALAAKGGQ